MSELEPLAAAMERNGVDVDELRRIGIDPSLIYRYDGERRKEDAIVVAMTVAKVPQIVTQTLAAQCYRETEDGDERVGHFRVEAGWVREYANGTLGRSEYVRKVLDTWTWLDGGEERGQ